MTVAGKIIQEREKKNPPLFPAPFFCIKAMPGIVGNLLPLEDCVKIFDKKSSSRIIPCKNFPEKNSERKKSRLKFSNPKISGIKNFTAKNFRPRNRSM